MLLCTGVIAPLLRSYCSFAQGLGWNDPLLLCSGVKPQCVCKHVSFHVLTTTNVFVLRTNTICSCVTHDNYVHVLRTTTNVSVLRTTTTMFMCQAGINNNNNSNNSNNNNSNNNNNNNNNNYTNNKTTTITTTIIITTTIPTTTRQQQ